MESNFLWICTSTHYVLHYYKVSGNFVELFQMGCANKKISSIFHFGQISKFKKGVTPRKKISCGYAHLHIMSFITTKFHEIMLSGFQRSCANKKNRTDGLTDERVKNIIPSATRCVGNLLMVQHGKHFVQYFTYIPKFLVKHCDHCKTTNMTTTQGLLLSNKSARYVYMLIIYLQVQIHII